MIGDSLHIIYNAIRTPDGTILHSKHRHDYITHIDANGELYMNDGGGEYLRRSWDNIPAEDLTVYADAPHEKIREHFYWGTYGKDPDYSEATFVKLKDLSNDHIKAILETQNHLPAWKLTIFANELAYRDQMNIYQKDTENYARIVLDYE